MNMVRRIGLPCIALLALIAQGVHSQDKEPPTQREIDDMLLAEYRTGSKKVPYGFWAIHADPIAGQGAVYRDHDGVKCAYRVAFVRDNVCIVEQQLPGSEVVVAVEFELKGAIVRLVRRAWVGRRGEKPFPATVLPVQRGGGGAVGLNGTYEDTKEQFTDFEQGGRKWSGTLTTTRFWKDKKQGVPDWVNRYWESEANWFKQSIRHEREERGAEATVAEMTEASDAFPPLLDWSEIPAPDAAENQKIRAPLITAAAAGDLQRLINGNLTFGKHWTLHPDAKVGDWAVHGGYRIVLVKLEQGRGIIESSPANNELGLVEAMEFEVKDGKSVEVIARFAGIEGQAPQPAKYSTFRDQRPVEVETGDVKQVEVAGRTWQAREVRTTRKSLQPDKPNAADEIIETLESDDAPFGLPLKSKSYWENAPERAYSSALTEVGKDSAAALDWSSWMPTLPWELPFTADDVKKFIKVGMNWRYSQVFDKGEEGLVTTYQDWKVKEVTDNGYTVECVLTHPDDSEFTFEHTYTWDEYTKRFKTWPRGSVERKSMTFGEREIDVTLYRFSFWGRDVMFGLSADLPGVRICTEEQLQWPSKVWLLEFHEQAKD